jgi:hypothetical protein
MDRVRIGVKPGQWGWSFDQLTAAWERIETLGFDVLSCFDQSPLRRLATRRGMRQRCSPRWRVGHFGSARVQRAYLAVEQPLNRAAGVVMGAFGARLVWERE